MSASLVEIERIYRERYPRFLRVAVALTGDRELGRDVVHEAFVQAIRSRETLKQPGSAEAWIWRILTNCANAEHRRAAHTVRGVTAGSIGEAQPEESELGGVRLAVAALPERQRTILFLRYYADLDYDAIAEAVGVARGTVAATLHAAHAALKTRLTEAPL
jgi:RNA polymerase sigma factor (sigma-70 family)